MEFLCFFTQSYLIFHPHWQINLKLCLEGSPFFSPTSYSISSITFLKTKFPKIKVCCCVFFLFCMSATVLCLSLSEKLREQERGFTEPWDPCSIFCFVVFFLPSLLQRHLSEVSWYVSKSLHTFFFFFLHRGAQFQSSRASALLGFPSFSVGCTFTWDPTVFLLGRHENLDGPWPCGLESGTPIANRHMPVCYNASH